MTVINIEEIKLEDSERQECEIWSRVMGYYRPVSEFNKGKKSEFYSRKCFTEEKALQGMTSCGCESIAAE
ncbi:MAG: anaerobic ribonucleoside-triphosphate reductase [Lactobacillus sp.]|jgi:hypothetical protein|nr:anaerobic ribonucleoside-triphosphate reductase [Lactobacillus sp.]